MFRTGSFVFLFSEPQSGSQFFRNRTVVYTRLFDEEVKAGYFQKGAVSPPREFPDDFLFAAFLRCACKMVRYSVSSIDHFLADSSSHVIGISN